MLFTCLLLSCTTPEKIISSAGWNLDFNLKEETFSVSHSELGRVLGRIRLHAKVNNEYKVLSGWKLGGTDNRIILSTTEPIEVRNDEFLTIEEARTCASMLSLSGMQYLSGDDLLNLKQDRLDIIKKTIPTLPISSQSITGSTYSLYCHVPEGFSPEQITTDGEDMTYDLDQNGLLTVSFAGREEPKDWAIKFSSGSN